MESEQTQSDWQVAVAAWWEVNKKAVAKLAIGAVLIGLAWYSWSYYKGAKETEASGALLALNRPPDGGGRPPVPSASEFLKVADQYSGTQAAERAELLAAGSLYAEKKYPEAKHKFEMFLSAHPEGILSEIAEFGIASCLNAANDIDKARDAYQQFISRHGSSTMVNQARLELGLLLEAKNQPEQALKLYDQVLRDKDETIWARAAEMRRDQLLEKYPHLAPAPAAVSASTNSMMSVISNIVAAAAATNKPPATNTTPNKK
jgi:predicted negative regulator of RcsB-dependent stress response